MGRALPPTTPAPLDSHQENALSFEKHRRGYRFEIMFDAD